VQHEHRDHAAIRLPSPTPEFLQFATRAARPSVINRLESSRNAERGYRRHGGAVLFRLTRAGCNGFARPAQRLASLETALERSALMAAHHPHSPAGLLATGVPALVAADPNVSVGVVGLIVAIVLLVAIMLALIVIEVAGEHRQNVGNRRHHA
jgi:hypothetical protein